MGCHCFFSLWFFLTYMDNVKVGWNKFCDQKFLKTTSLTNRDFHGSQQTIAIRPHAIRSLKMRSNGN